MLCHAPLARLLDTNFEQFNSYRPKIAATHIIDVLEDFLENMQTSRCHAVFNTTLDILAIAVVSISSGLKQSVHNMWQSVKVRICTQWSTRGRFAEARQLFFYDLSYPELDPNRPSPNPIPDWFVKRMQKEFGDSQLNCTDFASNNWFYQTAWQSVPEKLVKKMEDGGQSNKTKIWAKCKKILETEVKTLTAMEHEARGKMFTRYFALQREYKTKGVLWSNALAEEAYCVTMMMSGDFMHRVLQSVEIIDKAKFKIDGKPDGAASCVQVRVHASEVGEDEWYGHKTINIPMIDAKMILAVINKGDDFEIRAMAAFAAESMQRDLAGVQKAFETAKGMTESTAGIEYMETLAHSLLTENSSLTCKLTKTFSDMATMPMDVLSQKGVLLTDSLKMWMDTAIVPMGAFEEECVAEETVEVKQRRERQRAEMEASVRDFVVEVVESVPERAVQAREARQAELEARLALHAGLCLARVFDESCLTPRHRFLANPNDLNAAELRQAFAVKIRMAHLLQDEHDELSMAVQCAQQQKEATCRELQAVQTAMQTHEVELADARLVLQRLACEAQANATELEACRRVQASQGRVLEAMVSQVEEVVCGYKQELADMREKMESEEEKGLCCICLEARAAVALVPCGHVCVCPRCVCVVSSTGGQCPMCRADTTGVLSVFVA